MAEEEVRLLKVGLAGLEIGTAEEWDERGLLIHLYYNFRVSEQAKTAGLEFPEVCELVAVDFMTGLIAWYVNGTTEDPEGQVMTFFPTGSMSFGRIEIDISGED